MKILLRNKTALAIFVALFATAFINSAFAGQYTSQAQPAASTGSEVTLPDTPAGKTFAAFVKAFNTGDIETMKKFHTEHAGNPENAQKDFEFYQQSGGVKVIRIAKSSDYALEVIIETVNGAMQLNFAIEVGKNAPHAIQSIQVHPA
jgi:hypothetical protein